MTELIAKRFRALGEPMRLRILHALEGGEKPVSDIVELLESRQPNISKHLKALLQVGLVDRRRRGLNICYRIGAAHELPDIRISAIAAFMGERQRRLQRVVDPG